MLNKLLKYEIKSTARIFLPLYITLLFFAVINRLFRTMTALENIASFNLKSILSFVSSFAFFALMFGVPVITLVVVVQRFYKNLLGDEGYLMLTLPVRKSAHIINKLLVAMGWTIIGIVLVICSACIYFNLNIFEFVPEMLTFIRTYLGYTAYFFIPVLLILALACNILQTYAAIALGHLFSKHKLLASFGMYIVLYTAGQILSSIIVLFSLKSIFIPLEQNIIPTQTAINFFAIAVMILTAALTAAYFTITDYILKRKLNLE